MLDPLQLLHDPPFLTHSKEAFNASCIDFQLVLFEKLGVIQVDEGVLKVSLGYQQFGPCVIAYEMLRGLREAVL